MNALNMQNITQLFWLYGLNPLPPLGTEKIYNHDAYPNLTVYDSTSHNIMAIHCLDMCEDSVRVAFATISDYLYYTDGFDPKTQRCHVFEPDKFLNWKACQPQRGTDYIIWDLDVDQRNDVLFCQRKQLQAGDVVRRRYFDLVITDTPEGINEQGYYTQRIIDGPKYKLFIANREAVAEWRPAAGRWHWKG
jgi:hypothetical protein